MTGYLNLEEEFRSNTESEFFYALSDCANRNEIPAFHGFEIFDELCEYGFIIPGQSIIRVFTKHNGQIQNFSCLVLEQGFLQELKTGALLDTAALLGDRGYCQNWCLMNFDKRPHEVTH
ncbi:MAG: hypothetical protein V1865_02945 [bacterium]